MSAPRAAERTNVWLVALAGLIALAVGGGPLIMYVQGVFLKPMTTDLGWTRSEYFAPSAIAGIAGALIPPLVGLAADKIGVRKLLLPGVVAFAALYGALALVETPQMYTVLFVILMMLNGVNGPVLYAKAVALWTPRRAGLLMAIALAGSGIGGALLPPLTDWLIDAFGWRVARLTLAASVLVVALPMVWFFVWPPAAKTAGDSDNPKPAMEGLSIREAFRSRPFWLTLIALLMSGSASYAILVNLVPLLSDRGYSGAFATSMISILAIAQIAGRFLSGAMLDRVPFPQFAGIWFMLALIGALIISSGAGPVWIMIAAALVGLGLGSEIEIAAYFTTRFFGTRNYGQIYGYFISVFTLGSMSGPLILGVSFDQTGGYSAGLLVVQGLLLVSALLLLGAGRYRYAAPGH